MDDFCREKGIKREYSVARTPQQNGVAERKNRILIEAARIMLADSKLPTTFWAEAISIACYVQNRVLVVKPHNKTPYELFRGFKLALSFMRPFGCHESEENLHIGFLENKPMIEGNGPKWLFDIDSLSKFYENYCTVMFTSYFSNESARTQGEFSAGTSEEIRQDCIVIPIWKDASYFDSPSKDVDNGEPKFAADDQKQDGDGPDNCEPTSIAKAPLIILGEANAERTSVFKLQNRFGYLWIWLVEKRPLNNIGFQVTPKTSHLLAVKRFYRYLKGKPTLGLWYSRDSPFELVAYTDSDYAGGTQNRKSTTGGCQFLGNRLISWQCKKQTVVDTSTTEAEYVATASFCGQICYALTVNPTIYTSCIQHIWATAKAKMVNGDGTDCLQLLLCLRTRHGWVLDLERQDAQARRLADFKVRVSRGWKEKKSRATGLKRLKKVGMSRRVEFFEDQESLGDHEDASKQGRSIEDIDKDDDVSLVDGMYPGEQSAKEREVDTSVEDSATPTTIEEITLAQTLIQIKAAKPKVVTTAATTTTTTRPKARGVVVHDPSEFRTPQEAQPLMIKDKDKAIMIEPEVSLKRKD
ncbi:putative ribonuclease H-like domain-containing protein [Tanacetum coccineum]